MRRIKNNMKINFEEYGNIMRKFYEQREKCERLM